MPPLTCSLLAQVELQPSQPASSALVRTAATLSPNTHPHSNPHLVRHHVQPIQHPGQRAQQAWGERACKEG